MLLALLVVCHKLRRFPVQLGVGKVRAVAAVVCVTPEARHERAVPLAVLVDVRSRDLEVEDAIAVAAIFEHDGIEDALIAFDDE